MASRNTNFRTNSYGDDPCNLRSVRSEAPEYVSLYESFVGTPAVTEGTFVTQNKFPSATIPNIPSFVWGTLVQMHLFKELRMCGAGRIGYVNSPLPPRSWIPPTAKIHTFARPNQCPTKRLVRRFCSTGFNSYENFKWRILTGKHK